MQQIPQERQWGIARAGQMEWEEPPHDVAPGTAVGGVEEFAVVVTLFANDPCFGLPLSKKEKGKVLHQWQWRWRWCPPLIIEVIRARTAWYRRQ